MNLSDERAAAAFNEWMRRYIEDPAAFRATFQAVQQYEQERAGGKTPSYGETSVAFLLRLDRELDTEES